MEEINNEVSQGTNEKPVDRIKKENKIFVTFTKSKYFKNIYRFRQKNIKFLKNL